MLGPIGANAANKAANIHASYREADGGRKREILLSSAKRAEALQAAAPDFPNAPTKRSSACLPPRPGSFALFI